MTDQPKPTPGPWRVDTCSQLKGYIVGADDIDVARVERTNHSWQANAALIARAPELLAENAELTADLRTASDQAEALSKDNQRLRELLRRVADAAERDDFGGIGPELLEEVKHAIGRTGE